MKDEIKFIPGEYSAETKDLVHLKAKVKVDRNKIVDVKISSGKDECLIEPALEKVFRGQILKSQSVAIDGVSSASVLTKAVKTVVGKALADARDND